VEEYGRRLERIQINICVALILLLFSGLLILPRIGLLIWVAIVAAFYIRLTLVIAKREELLEKPNPSHDSNQRSAWSDARERRIVVPDSRGASVLPVDPIATEVIRPD
jgi:hypothetical protein